ncbi:hypothetical protein ACNTMW_33665 [Planosporangium sp. 12N6]|uniref:hypothetical protein n=1 Tax=Planosporangium spinosum TaxID=3402278 RepID=UPI003CF84696
MAVLRRRGAGKRWHRQRSASDTLYYAADALVWLPDEVDAAAEALAPVLALPPQERINGVIHSVQRVHRALARSGLAADAPALIDQIEGFSHTPLTALAR